LSIHSVPLIGALPGIGQNVNDLVLWMEGVRC
jgi:hypothetical protein